MSELTNVHARSIKDLTAPISISADPNTFDQVKLPAGNFPPEYEGIEALTLELIKNLAAQGREEELEAVNLKIANEEIRAKEVEAALIKDKANKATTLLGYGITDAYTQGQIDSKVNNLEVKKANKIDVDTAFSNLSTNANKYYSTLAAANADIANIALNQSVTIGEAVNGGLWYKATAGATSLTKSPYDPLSEANNFTLEQADELQSLIYTIASEVHKLIFNTPSKLSLFDFADTDGSIVMQLTTDGKLNLVDMDEDVATAINENSNFVKAKLTEFSNKNLIEFIDSEGNLIAYFDKDSKFYIVGLETDVVTAINSKSESGLSTKDTSNLSNYSYRDTFIPKAQNLLNFFRNNHDVGLLAPVPLQSFEQNFTIGTAWINQANIAEWGDYIPVKTPYGNDRGVVHPHILEFPNKFMGCRYIIAITGYTNGRTQEENPFLLGSNDLQSFELLTPVLDEPASYTWEKGIVYNSDPFMFYDIKTGELCLIFREYWADTSGVSPSQTHEFLYIRRTKDGKSWSERELMWGNQAGTLMSPAVIYDVRTETYHMYAVGRSNGSAYGLIHLTSKTLKNDWEVVGLITPPSDSSVWHVDVKIIGDKQVLTFQNRVGSTSVGFKTGIASDFHNFTWADNWWNPLTYEIYKASFLPQFNEQNEMRLVYVWTTNHKPTSDLRYKLFAQATPFLNVNYLEK